MAAAEVDAVSLEERDLRVGEEDGVVLGGPLEAQQALRARLEVMAQPTPRTPDALTEVLQAQLVGDALRAVRRKLQGVVEDPVSISGLTRFGCGARAPRRASTRAAVPPTWKARRTS